MNLFAQIPLAIVCATLASVATLLGAVFARSLQARFENPIWPWAFSGGSLLALAILDLIPESLTLTTGAIRPVWVMSLLILGAVIFLALNHLEQAIINRPSNFDDSSPRLPWRGLVMIMHSLIDGIAIGIGFSAAGSIGWLMAVAIIAHDVGDGFNSVILTADTRSPKTVASGWIWANVLAPPVGAGITLALNPSRGVVGALLALLAGLFLAISVGEILPRLLSFTRPTSVISGYIVGALLMGALLWSLGS